MGVPHGGASGLIGRLGLAVPRAKGLHRPFALTATARIGLVRQARAHVSLANAILYPGSLRLGGNPATALLLLRSALTLALQSLEPLGARERPLAELLESLRARPPLLAAVETRAAPLAAVEQTLVRPDLAAIAERSDPRIEADACQAERMVSRLLAALPDPDTARIRVLRRRALWALAAITVLLTLVYLGARFGNRWLHGPNLAARATFRTSSSYGGFSPEHRTSSGRPAGVFFHTAEEDSPWIEYDLGRARAVHRIELENRSDCCGERAVPLVVEVGLDQQRFHEVARRGEAFSVLALNFAKTEARYVRVRVDRRSMLHLVRVRIR